MTVLESSPMRRTGAGLLLAVGLVLGFTSMRAAASEDEPKRRTIQVTGYGEVSVSPDLAIISFAVETAADRASEAVEQNADRSSKVAAAIKQRLDSKDRVSTTRYSLEPRYQQPERGSTAPPRITGYVARNEVRLETHRLDRVGQLIDAASGAGANRISELQFTLEDRNPQLRAALAKAGEESRAQAESIASALGVSLKQVVAASTQFAPIVPRRYEGAAMMAAAEARAPTSVEPGEVTVSATKPGWSSTRATKDAVAGQRSASTV